MKSSAARKAELAIQKLEAALESVVDVVERLPATHLSDSLMQRLRATASVNALPVATLPIGCSLDAIAAWIVGLLPDYFAGSTIWIGTGIQDFPLLRVKPKSAQWVRHLVNSHGELDQVLVSEDLRLVGRLSTEEARHEFIVSS